MLARYETERDNRKLPDCWRCRNDRCSPHFHSSLELAYVTQGTLVGALGGQRHTLHANSLMLCPSYSLHWYETPQASMSIVMTVPTDFIPSFAKVLEQSCFERVTAQLEPKNEIRHCLECLCKIARVPPVNKTLLKGYVYTLMGLLVEELGICPIKSGGQTDFAREILLYMEAHYTEPLTPESVAASFGYSKSRFSHLFSQTLGYTFCGYLHLLRCRHAAMLMVNRSTPVLEAAMSAGYDNIRTFYRNFKEVFGMTPSQYVSASSGFDKQRAVPIPKTPNLPAREVTVG